MHAVLIIAALLVYVLSSVLAALVPSGMLRFFTSVLLGGIMLLSVAFAAKETGRQEEHLPKVAGLCRGTLSLSWKVAKDDVEKISDALQKDAGCTVRITKVPTPPAFPKR